MYTKFVVTISLFTVVCVSIAFIPSCTEPFKNEISARLSFSEAPALGKVVEVSLVFFVQKDYRSDLKNASARLLLPKEFEVLSGDLGWHGDIVQNQTYAVTAVVRATQIGNYVISGNVAYSPSVSSNRGNGDDLYVSVFENRAEVREKPKAEITYVRPDTSGATLAQ